MNTWRQLLDAIHGLEGLSLVLGLVAGLGGLGFVAGSWVLHLVASGQPARAALAALAAAGVGAAALARVPIALVLVLGAAAIVGAALGTGSLPALLP